MTVHAVGVYCASGDVPGAYLALAAELGQAIANRGWGVVSGGGKVSMMGALAQGARENGGHTLGVIPHVLLGSEIVDDGADDLRVVDTMRQRKEIMEDSSDAFIVLPGGVGTLEEFFETWTAGYLGVHDKPVVVLDPQRFYEPLFAWLQGLVPEGFVKASAMDRITVVTTIDDALNACERRE